MKRPVGDPARWRWLPLAVAGGILLGSLLPPAVVELSGVTSALSLSLSAPPFASAGPASAPFGVGADKVVHALSYAVLGWVSVTSDGRQRHASLLLVVLAVAGFGAGVEVAQSFLPGRTASAGDAAANLVGAVAGVVGWLTVGRLRRRRGQGRRRQRRSR